MNDQYTSPKKSTFEIIHIKVLQKQFFISVNLKKNCKYFSTIQLDLKGFYIKKILFSVLNTHFSLMCL